MRSGDLRLQGSAPVSPTFMADLRADTVMLAAQCPAVALLWRRAGFDPSRDLSTLADASRIPPILSASFKRSANLYLKLLRRPLGGIDTFTVSSSTSGDPSIIGRTQADIQAYASAFRRGFETCHGGAPFDRVFALWPDPDALLALDHGRVEGKPIAPFAANVFKTMGPVREPSHRDFLLCLRPGAPSEIDFDKIVDGLDGAQRRGERVLIGGTPIFVHMILTYLSERVGRRWVLGTNGYVLVGAGGWDGRKGTMDLGRGISRSAFIAQAVDIFGIPPEHVSDHYGFSESGLSFPGAFDGDDFSYAIPPQAHVVLRDPLTLDPFDEPEREGLVEVISPYGNSSHAATALLVDDLASFVPDTENRRLRIHGRAPSSHKSGCGAMLQ